MKTLLTGALMLLFTIPSFAQANGTTTDGYQPFTLPANPSARQITKLLIETTEGIHDPFAVLRKIGSMGNAVVPALKTFLFNTPTIKVASISPEGKRDSVLAPKPHKVYAIEALELIGTPQAYQVVASAAQSDSNIDVKGMALRALSTTYYERAREDSLVPDKQVVSSTTLAMPHGTWLRLQKVMPELPGLYKKIKFLETQLNQLKSKP